MSTRVTPNRDIRDAILEAGGAEAYQCYQCGNCMAVCPWYHIEAIAFPVYRTPLAVKLGAVMASDDAEAIEREVSEVYRCVGCEACTAWCPHGVSLPDILRAVRRILVEFGSFPAELKDSVSRVQSSGNPFGEPRAERARWTEGLEVPSFSPGMEILHVPCCVPAYDPRAAKTAQAAVAALQRAGVSVGVLRSGESCCGEAIRRVGAEELFRELAAANITAFEEVGAHTVMVTSPHCFLSFRGDYRELGADFEVLHQTQLLQRLVAEGRLEPKQPLGRRVVYHDPCTLGRQSGIFDEPRELLRSIPDLELVEFPTYNRELSLCCGGGSGGVWLERPRDERLAELRVRQAIETGAEILAVACPYCLQMFEDAVRTMELSLEVRDVAELLADSL